MHYVPAAVQPQLSSTAFFCPPGGGLFNNMRIPAALLALLPLW